MSFLLYILGLIITTFIMIVGNRQSLNNTLEKRAALRTINLIYTQQISDVDLNNMHSTIKAEDKRILISKRTLNFWGVFLSQGAISITLMALLVWFSKHTLYNAQNGLTISIPNTEIFLYGFLLIIQYFFYQIILNWKNNYMLDLLPLSKEDIRMPFSSNGWNMNEEGKLIFSTLIGSIMLLFSIYLLEIFIS